MLMFILEDIIPTSKQKYLQKNYAGWSVSWAGLEQFYNAYSKWCVSILNIWELQGWMRSGPDKQVAVYSGAFGR